MAKKAFFVMFWSMIALISSSAFARTRDLSNHYDFRFLECTEFGLYPVFKVVADECRKKSEEQTLAILDVEPKFRACLKDQPLEASELCLRNSSPIAGKNHCISLEDDPEVLVATHVIADTFSETALDMCTSDEIAQIQRGVKHVKSNPGSKPPQFDHLVPITIRHFDQTCEYIVEISGYEVRASACNNSW